MLAVGALLLTPGVPLAAAASSQPGDPCTNPTVSAANQYCQDVPSATGPRAGSPGSSSSPGTSAASSSPGTSAASGGVATELPRRIVHRLLAAGSGAGSGATARRQRASRALLDLPAPGRRVALSSAPADASAFSLFDGLIVLLALVTVAVGATAVVRRRRGLAA